MNDRIHELAKECYVVTGSVHTDHFAYWKFAELIIRECASKVTRNEALNIFEHFGIE